jgi:hypothetical protein
MGGREHHRLRSREDACDESAARKVPAATYLKFANKPENSDAGEREPQAKGPSGYACVMHVINEVQLWLNHVLSIGVTVFMVWAFIDCGSRKAAAFPAAGKLTKPAWMLLTGIPAVLSLLLLLTGALSVDGSLLVYIAMIVAAVYMADVRPAVREISGPCRW